MLHVIITLQSFTWIKTPIVFYEDSDIAFYFQVLFR